MKKLITAIVSCVLLLTASLTAYSGYDVKFTSARSSEYKLDFNLQNFKFGKKIIAGKPYS